MESLDCVIQNLIPQVGLELGLEEQQEKAGRETRVRGNSNRFQCTKELPGSPTVAVKSTTTRSKQTKPIDS